MTTLAVLMTVFVAQAGDVPALTADETAASQTITEGKLLSTVSFLSSDEMAGRDTPSPELNIAAAYVASRLRGAGLEPLDPDGSFYQETTVDTVRAPSGAVFVTGSDARSFGLMFGGDEAISFEGEIAEVAAGANYSGPVWMTAPEPRGTDPRSQMMTTVSVVRSAANLKRAGATAMVVVANETSPLVVQAKKFQAREQMVGRRSLSSALPILLVSAPPSGKTRLALPAQLKGKAIVRNVMGVVRGSDPEMAKQAVLFSAHLDHIGRASGTDPVNNGADDDATGVTAVLALADAFGSMKTKPKRSTVFMTFWGEEKGLLGSKYYGDHPMWPLDQTVANINIEMVGRPEQGAEGTSWMTGWNQSDLGSIMFKGAARAGVRVFEHKRFSQMLYRQSDNYSLVKVGVVAHSFSAGSLHEDYHQPSDEWQKLQIPHMTKVVRGLFAGSLPIAQGQFTPKPAK